MLSLKNYSDKELVHRLRELVHKEQDLTLEILPFLAEVGSRGLYLCKGYGSLYEYCKNELGYTDASAWRRVRAALAIQRCPGTLAALSQKRVTMCALGRVYKFITPAILEKICDKSQVEIELIAAVYDAKGAAPDKTRVIMVPKAKSPGGNLVPVCRGTDEADAGELRSEVTAGNDLEFEKKWKVEGVISSRVKDKLDRCKTLLSNKYPNGVDYDTLFDELTEVFLERQEPERRVERRESAKKQRGASVATSGTRTRHIARRTKDEVWKRDGGRCAFVGENGRRCNSTRNLQFDHHPARMFIARDAGSPYPTPVADRIR